MGQAGGETGEGEAQETFCWTGSKNLFGLLPGEFALANLYGKLLNSFEFLLYIYCKYFEGLRVDSMTQRNSRLQSVKSY